MAVLVTVVLEGSPLFLRVSTLRASLSSSPRLCGDIFRHFVFFRVCICLLARRLPHLHALSLSLSVRCLRSIPHARKTRVRAKER